MSDRIPTSRWPFFSTTLEADIAASTSQAFLTFEAERDTLFTDLSIVVTWLEGTLDGSVSIEYCNVTYADHTDIEEFGYCCNRKPIFLVGVKENKKLRFQIDLTIPAPPGPGGGAHVILTLSGFQGIGCCS